MTWESLVFLGFAAAALGILVCRTPRRGRGWTLGVLLVPSSALGWWLAGYAPPPSGERVVADRPIEAPEQGYVSSDACQACHPGNHATWHASYHRTMTQVAGPDSVLGDFAERTLRLGDFTYRLSRRGDDYWVEIDPAPDGFMAYPSLRQRRVALVTGSHHYQVYWLTTANGREVEQFPLAYLVGERQWVSRAATLITPPREFSGVRPGGWNRSCIRCHTTHGRPRWPADGAADSQVSEMGIACEACHGPGGEHVRAQREPFGRYAAHLGDAGDPTIVDPADLPQQRSVEVCGQCHGITELRSPQEVAHWHARGYDFRPGDDLSATRQVVRYSDYLRARQQGLSEEQSGKGYFDQRFWPDGTIRVTGREYNALLDTPCFQRGPLTCLSCHVMHRAQDDPRPLREWADDQLGPGMRGARACLQCHAEYEDTAARQAHTHHLPGSSGSDCYNCHMPYSGYGLLKAVRSHTIDNPDVSASVRAGRPNACNQCHLDRSLAWSAEHLERWYGTPAPELDDDERTIAASLLWSLRGDAGQRALAAWSLGWPDAHEASGVGWIAPHLARLLDDPYDAVRFITQRSLRSLPGFADFEYDFEAQPGDRRAAVRRAIERWRLHGAGDDRDAQGAVRIDSRDALDDVVIGRLLAARDDRPVQLTE
jgi:hypothetical protein